MSSQNLDQIANAFANQTSAMQAMQEQITNMQINHAAQLQAAQAAQVAQEAQLNELRNLATGPPANPSGTMPNMTALPRFSGTDRSALRGFLNQLNIFFEMHPNHFVLDKMRSSVLIFRLDGTALAWAQRYYESQDPVLQSFPAFTALFKQTFDDPGRIAESARKIRYISQGTRDISDYVAQFQLLASDLDYNDQAFLALFKGGLAMEINTLLFNRNIQSATLAELIANSISCANALREFKANNPAQHAMPPAPRIPPRFDDGMDLDAMEPYRPASFGPKPRLQENERERRMRLKLCLYCGQPGHYLDKCPTRPARKSQGSRKMNAAPMVIEKDPATPATTGPATSPATAPTPHYSSLPLNVRGQ